MKIEFELNEAQSRIMQEAVEFPNNKGKNANQLCKEQVVQALVQFKQMRIAQELKD